MISHVFSITPDVSSAVLVRRPGLFHSPPWRGPGPSRRSHCCWNCSMLGSGGRGREDRYMYTIVLKPFVCM